MLLKFFRILAFFLRIIFFYSEKFKLMTSILLFPKLLDSQVSLKENEFLFSFFSKPFLENSNYFTSIILRIFLKILEKNELLKISFYSLMDIMVGIFLSKIKFINQKSKKNLKEIELSSWYLEMIYLYNPLAIMCCGNLQLRTIYNFLLIICVRIISGFFNGVENEEKNLKNLILFLFEFINLLFINLCFVITLIISPSNFMILGFFYFKNFENLETKQKLKALFNLMISLIFIFFSLGFLFGKEKEPIATFYFYYNYFFMKDTLPNYGILWNLIPEIFLKYTKFNVIYLIVYQIAVNVLILVMSMKIQYYKYNKSLYLAISFLVKKNF